MDPIYSDSIGIESMYIEDQTMHENVAESCDMIVLAIATLAASWSSGLLGALNFD
jgi:hypothetical protein